MDYVLGRHNVDLLHFSDFLVLLHLPTLLLFFFVPIWGFPGSLGDKLGQKPLYLYISVEQQKVVGVRYLLM